MGVVDRILGRPAEERSSLSFSEWLSWFQFNGSMYPLGLQTTLPGEREERPDGSFQSYVGQMYKANGVVFACMLVRLLLFSEARFQYRRLRSGRPGELFSTRELGRLQRPWANGTTGDLLTRAIQDADLAGNSYTVRRGDGLKRLRPDWVTIVLGSMSDPAVTAEDVDAEVVGYSYKPGGQGSQTPPVFFMADQVAHFAPIPDPACFYRGMSWLTPIVREVLADGAATSHKLKFFENGATPNMVVSLDPTISKDAFQEWVAMFSDKHEGLANAYRTLYLGGGASVEVVGSNLGQLDFKVTQGAGETRIAAAAGVPPVIVGLSEGLSSATYSNYSQARRRFADGTMRPLWRNMAASLSTVVAVPGDAELWYDDRDIPFLQEDQKDAAEIQQTHASSIKVLIDAGYKPDSVVDAVTAGDLARLEHTGLYSIQLQPPGTPLTPRANGNTPAAIPANT